MKGSKPHERGLMTGRFHPFHLEHLRYFHWVREQCETVIIGITNPDFRSIKRDDRDSHRHLPEDNPYTYTERLMMIRQALHCEGVSLENICIVPVPLHDPEVWSAYVPADTVAFVVAYSPWEHSKAERMNDAGMTVVVDDSQARGISGSRIRELMKTNGDWQSLVPQGVANYLARKPLEH